MKNIFEIMKEYGLEVAEDKKNDFEKSVLENYKIVTDYDNQTKKLDAANDTIKANDTAMKDLQGMLDRAKRVKLKYNRGRKGGKRTRYRNKEELIQDYMAESKQK